MKRSTFKWTIVGNVMVSCSTAGQIPDDEWNAYIKGLGTGPVAKAFALSIGSLEVNSVHRKQVADTVTSKGIHVAMVTDERLVRGLVTAVSWLGVNIKPFSWSEIKEAIKHLGVPEGQSARVYETAMKLRQECEAIEYPGRKAPGRKDD